ncbi:MAG: TetR/AcrR family transcriptional regulator [Acidobacteriota bacterium]
MGPRDRRSREKEELKDKILDAARELFVAEGYERVTMRKIAERIEYSPTAIYLHFPDKLAVIRALCDLDFMTLAKQFQKIAKIADPIERLRQVGRAYTAFALSHPNHYQLMFMTPLAGVDKSAGSGVERGNPEVDAYAFLKWIVTDAIASGRLRPEYKDVDELAQMSWAAVHGVVSLYIAKCDDDWVEWRPAKKTAAALIDAMLRGLLRESKT